MELLGNLAMMVTLARWEKMGDLVTPAVMEILVQMGSLAILVNKDCQEMTDSQVNQEIQVHRDSLEDQVIKEELETQEVMVSQGYQERREHQANQVHQDLEEMMEHPDKMD